MEETSISTSLSSWFMYDKDLLQITIVSYQESGWTIVYSGVKCQSSFNLVAVSILIILFPEAPCFSVLPLKPCSPRTHFQGHKTDNKGTKKDWN